MGFEDFETFVPQEDYPVFGLVSTVVGFFLLSYFFMYSSS